MKKRLFIKSCLVASVALFAASCSDDTTLGSIDDAGRLDVPEGAVVYITDAAGSRGSSKVEFHNAETNALHVKTGAALPADCKVTFAYNADALNAYNTANGTDYTILPQSMVAFANDGVVTLPAGQTAVDAEYTLTSDGSLDPETTYALPLSVTIEGAAALGEADKNFVVLVRDLSSYGDCHKTWIDDKGVEHEGIKIFSVMEVNDTNPLNNLRYKLKNSGKYMVDALVMFSGNINYDAEQGRVYFFPNENVKAILDNREKYLKPLKDRGMKVIMGVMCNHDRACIANLDDNTAKLFAKELKALCDAYGLDGIFWDDEYCSPITPAPPGFVTPGRAAWSRLAYEVWKIQPERWNIAYGYSTTGSAVAVDGVQPGTFISYCLPDYSSSYTDRWLSSYPGMTLSQLGGCSMEFAQGRWSASESTLRNMRNEGFGAMMVFAMDPYRTNASGQEQAMNKLARAFYNDEVVVDQTTYPKDWK